MGCLDAYIITLSRMPGQYKYSRSKKLKYSSSCQSQYQDRRGKEQRDNHYKRSRSRQRNHQHNQKYSNRETIYHKHERREERRYFERDYQRRDQGFRRRSQEDRRERRDERRHFELHNQHKPQLRQPYKSLKKQQKRDKNQSRRSYFSSSSSETPFSERRLQPNRQRIQDKITTKNDHNKFALIASYQSNRAQSIRNDKEERQHLKREVGLSLPYNPRSNCAVNGDQNQSRCFDLSREDARLSLVPIKEKEKVRQKEAYLVENIKNKKEQQIDLRSAYLQQSSSQVFNRVGPAKISPVKRTYNQKFTKEEQVIEKQRVAKFDLIVNQAKSNLAIQSPPLSFLVLDSFRNLSKFEQETIDSKWFSSIKGQLDQLNNWRQKLSTQPTELPGEAGLWVFTKDIRNEEQMELKQQFQELRLQSTALSDMARKLKVLQ